MEILNFKAWNNMMSPVESFIAIARIKLPNSSYSARFQKIRHSNDEITLEVVLEFPETDLVSDDSYSDLDIRYDEDGLSYEYAGLVSGERVEVGEVS